MRVRYYCHAGQNTGFGRAALDYALALTRFSDVELDLRPLQPAPLCTRLDEIPSSYAGRVMAPQPFRGPPDLVLIHTLPRDCHRVLELEGITAGTPTVAYTTWEAVTMRDTIAGAGLARFDAVLTPSAASLQPLETALGPTSGGWPRIGVIPHCYDSSVMPPDLAAFDDGYKLDQDPDRVPYTFYYVGAWNRRKNINGVIRAFAHAFGEMALELGGTRVRDVVRLHLHCPGAAITNLYVALAAMGDPLHQVLPVELTTNHLPEENLWDLHRGADCFVTASRGEAWGLGSFEAALAWNHVIAPAGEGSDAYLQATSADLYPAPVQPAQLDAVAELQGQAFKVTTSGPQGLSALDLWREPDILRLSSSMRLAFHKRTRTLKMAPADRLRFHAQTVGPQLAKELERIHGQRNDPTDR